MADDMDEKLARAQERATKAQSTLLKIRRQIDGENRKRETQRLCTLGRAVGVWTAENDALREAFRAFLGRYLSRPGDFEVLEGTPFGVERPANTETAKAQKAFDNLNIVAHQKWMDADPTTLKSVANQLRNFIRHVVEGVP